MFLIVYMSHFCPLIIDRVLLAIKYSRQGLLIFLITYLCYVSLVSLLKLILVRSYILKLIVLLLQSGWKYISVFDIRNTLIEACILDLS